MPYRQFLTAVFVVFVALLMSACAPTRYAIEDHREPVQATAPVELPAWPDGVLVVCPRGNWDPQAKCPSGTEWIAYDAAGADALHEFAIAGQANTEIASLQADQIEALDAEAAARTATAAELQHELKWRDVERYSERFGWILGVGALIAIGL